MRLIINPDKYIKPNILLNPFDHKIDYNTLSSTNNILDYFKEKSTITKDGREAICLSLIDAVKSNNINNLSVLIVTSSSSNYVSSCVTKSIEKYGTWTMDSSDNYNCIFLIHEFGCFANLPENTISNVPLIEDFAPSFFLYKKSSVKSNYQIFSFSKFFSVQEGGLVSGLQNSNTSNYKLTDYTLSILQYELNNLTSLVEKRNKNGNSIINEFIKLGFLPFYDNYLQLIPWAVMIKNHKKIKDLEKLKVYFENHGILMGIFYGNDSFYLPSHQNLDKFEIDYIINVFKSFLENEI